MTQPQSTPIEAKTAKRGSGTIWLWPGDDTVVTASPTVVCVWENQELVNRTEGLISGPWVPATAPRTEQDLIAWFEQWLAAGEAQVSAVVANPVNPELYVIVSIAQRKKGGKPIIHAWGQGLVVDNGVPYTDKQHAQRERRKAIRTMHERGERPEEVQWTVCKVLGTDASYVDEQGIGRPL